MAHAGQVIENPPSGERITFHLTAAQTSGELVVIDLEVAAGGRMPAGPHVHPEQEERFEVVRGRMRFRMRGKRILAGPGQVVVVPPGVRHDWANAGDDPALVRVEIRPALAMERLFATAVALAREGRSFANGIPAARPSAVRARGAGRVPAAVGAADRDRAARLDRRASRLWRPLRPVSLW